MFDSCVAIAPAPDAAVADPVGSALGRLTGAAADLDALAGGCGDWPAERRREALHALDRLAGLLTSTRSRLLVVEEEAGSSLAPGDRDFASARARLTRGGLGQARREVAQARTLADLPRVADGLRAGAVPVGHLEALARVAEGAGEQARAALRATDVQDRLVSLAAQLPARDFAASAARLVASFDPAALERGAAAAHAQRFLVLTPVADGVLLKGRLDRVRGEVLRVALAATGHAPDAERDKPQADADALVALAERAVSGMAGVRARRADAAGRPAVDPEQDVADATVSGRATRPVLSVLVPAETFAEVRRAQQARATGADRAERAVRPVEPAALEDGTPVAMSELARMLCDCEVGRIVLGADGVPLDLGRSTRLYTAAQRRAVIVRDRHCAWNGCQVPAAYCEVHHNRWWDRDLGPTDLDNGVLLCSHHHHTVHALDLTATRLRPGAPGGEGRGGGRRARAADPSATQPPPTAAPPPTGAPPPGSGGSRARGRPMLGEPMRYSFARRDGRVVNAPVQAAA